MDKSNNCLAILLGPIYLARYRSSEVVAVVGYLAEAETRALRLNAIHGDATPTQAGQVEVGGNILNRLR